MPKRALLVGSKDAGKFFECSRYTWWNHRQCQTSLLPDRKFSTRRLAALYVAKQNSDELSIAAREAGKTWEELVPSDGVYAVRPHAPFRASAVDDFLELSDDELELYGNAGARCAVRPGGGRQKRSLCQMNERMCADQCS